MNSKKETTFLFLGLTLGIIGNFLVSSVIELAKAITEKSPLNILLIWVILFIASSIAFFQPTKHILKSLDVTKSLWMFDVATLICIGLGILVLIIHR